MPKEGDTERHAPSFALPVSLKKQKAQHPPRLHAIYAPPPTLHIPPRGIPTKSAPYHTAQTSFSSQLTIPAIYFVPSFTHFSLHPLPHKDGVTEDKGGIPPQRRVYNKNKDGAGPPPESGPERKVTVAPSTSISQTRKGARPQIRKPPLPEEQVRAIWESTFRTILAALEAKARRRLGAAQCGAVRSVAPRPTPRPIARPRAPALPRPQASAPSASASPAEGPPGEGGEGGEGGAGSRSGTNGDGDGPPPPPPHARSARGQGKARAKGKRGRPRKRKAFRAWTDGRTFRKRLAKLDGFVKAAEGRGVVLFVTLAPARPPSPEDRGLSRVPAHVQDDLKKLRADLRRRKASHALATATRNDAGAFFPHVHGLVAGVDRATLERLAAERGFALNYAEVARDVSASARYIVAAHQKREWDRLEGGRGFYVYVPDELPPEAEVHAAEAPAPAAPHETPAPACSSVSLGNSDGIAQVLRSIAANPPPGPVPLGPGVVVVNPARFLAALLDDLNGPPVLRRAALANARAFLKAISNTGPPVPPSSPPMGKGVVGRGRP